MKPPAFQFYADDFLAGVADMTQSEVGAYILLLCNQWSRGEIPTDPTRAALIAKGEVSGYVMAKFPSGKNCRMERERTKQAEFREQCAAAGRRGGGNPAFRAGNHNPYKQDKGTLKGSDKGTLKGSDKGDINSPSPSPSPSPITSLIPDDVGGKPAVSRAPRASTSTDGEWLAGLKSNPTYLGVDVDRELGKMQAWCAANRKEPTRRRFVNWLNRCDKPMSALQREAGWKPEADDY